MRYLDKSIEELHELLKNKTIKPIDLVEEAFARIEENKDLYYKSLDIRKILKIINLNQNNLGNLVESLQKQIWRST